MHGSVITKTIKKKTSKLVSKQDQNNDFAITSTHTHKWNEIEIEVEEKSLLCENMIL